MKLKLLFSYEYTLIWGYHNWLPGGSDGKVSACNAGDLMYIYV